MNLVSGKVLLKETNVGISDLLVEIYDVDPGTRVSEVGNTGTPKAIAQTPVLSTILAKARRLVSGATLEDGSFKLEYEDTDSRASTPKKQVRNLLLIVRAPEEMTSSSTTNVLHVANEIRQNASSKEVYIIRIPTEKLLAAGISLPTNVTLDVDEPEAVIQKVNLNVMRQVQIRQKVQAIAAVQVETERQRTIQLETEVANRLLEKLSGVPDKLAERLNYVKPGTNVDAAMFKALNNSIKGKINKKPPAKGFIVLSEEQAKKFKKPDGTFRDDISPEEIKLFFFGSSDDDQRPTFLIRENPADLTRPSQPPPILFESDAQGDGSNDKVHKSAFMDSEVPSTDRGNSPASIPDTIPEFVNRLIGSMTSPEEAIAFGVKPRPTQDTIEGDVGNFEVHSGPADVPAFYDFHSLEIAFDYVWQKAIDEGVLINALELSRKLQDMGGDPITAMKNESDPIKALRNEVKIVQTAMANSGLNQVATGGNDHAASR